MRKIIPIFVFSCICLLPQIGSAQIKQRKIPKETEKTEDNSAKTTKTDDLFDESGGFKHRLQYMFHTDQGLFQIFGNSFALRLDPSVGYKINKWASAGLTVGVAYAYARLSDGATTATMRATDYSYGAYGRVKLFNALYFHTDYKLATYERPLRDNAGNMFLDPNNSTRILTTKQRNNPEWNVGAAYRSGSAGWAYELMLLYDVNYKASSFKGSPLDLKMGFSYNF
jgi:hypothetical protein